MRRRARLRFFFLVPGSALGLQVQCAGPGDGSAQGGQDVELIRYRAGEAVALEVRTACGGALDQLVTTLTAGEPLRLAVTPERVATIRGGDALEVRLPASLGPDAAQATRLLLPLPPPAELEREGVVLAGILGDEEAYFQARSSREAAPHLRALLACLEDSPGS